VGENINDRYPFDGEDAVTSSMSDVVVIEEEKDEGCALNGRDFAGDDGCMVCGGTEHRFSLL
jgi:hypothetical protein